MLTTLATVTPGVLLAGLPGVAPLVPQESADAYHAAHPVLALCVAGAVLTGGVVAETVRHRRRHRVIRPQQLPIENRPYLRVHVMTSERKRTNDHAHAAALAAHRP